MATAVCPGSFDPVTVGHLDIITRASKMFDSLIVVVMTNQAKAPAFTEHERAALLKTATAELQNVVVDTYDGLLADYAALQNAAAIVKGLRAVSDFEYEFQMALTNKKLNPRPETIFLPTSAEYMYLSSGIVKQIAMYGGDISGFVPLCVLHDIEKRLKKNAPVKDT